MKPVLFLASMVLQLLFVEAFIVGIFLALIWN